MKVTKIKQEDVIESVADALQFMSYYHPLDYIEAIHEAYKHEQSVPAKDALAQILHNSRMCAEGHRPICQDTGIVVAFVRIGMSVQWSADVTMNIEDMVNAGVRKAYLHATNKLRASIVSDPAGDRKNTRDNTPAIVHIETVLGNELEVRLAAKGGGSENKAKLAMLNPNDDIVDWVVNTVPTMGAGWCPPGILGIGIGGTAEKATILAKESLMDAVDIHKLKKSGATNAIEQLRLTIFDKVNALGIGAQGLGGLTTVVDVKIKDYPTHAASLPVAIIPNCAATRHAHFTLSGSGPALFEPPDLKSWPDVKWRPAADAKRIDLNSIDKSQIATLRPGDTLLLSGDLITGRDAAHRRLQQLIENGEPLPANVNFDNKFIYYVGPVDPVADEVVGPAGPTTATRMDKFTEFVLSNTGLIGMIGKAERGEEGIKAIKKHGAVYLIAVGGAAFLISQAIKKAEVLAFEDLGMEAIYGFTVKDMPVTVAVDSRGESIHEQGPNEWRKKIAAQATPIKII